MGEEMTIPRKIKNSITCIQHCFPRSAMDMDIIAKHKVHTKYMYIRNAKTLRGKQMETFENRILIVSLRHHTNHSQYLKFEVASNPSLLLSALKLFLEQITFCNLFGITRLFQQRV